MILDKFSTQNAMIESSMQAASLRQNVILNNIANADTPNFKKSEVSFEDDFQTALYTARRTGDYSRVADVTPQVNVVDTNYDYRIDKNNVDIEQEMVNLYQNSMRYDTMVSSVSNNYQRINMVLQAK